MHVLVVNAGSSSLKLRLLGPDDRLLFSEDLALRSGTIDQRLIRDAVAAIDQEIDAVGHRVVHGGSQFTGPVLLDGEVENALRDLCILAPLHQEKSLAGIDAVRDLLPELPSVACFDTAFHATLTEGASTYAVPIDWRSRLGVRRFGFHGLSHSYAGRRAAEILGRPIEELRLVSCHLGAGASLAAIASGKSVDTTMGFTPLEGLVMGTRSGTVDPGLVTWLIESVGMTARDVSHALEHESGLLALAGTSDMAMVEADAQAGNARARLAVTVYVHRLRAGIAAMVSAMGGIDGLVFTGGVGENASLIRFEVAAELGFLGIGLDEKANDSVAPDADVTAPGRRVRTLVVQAREDLQIASEVRSLLG